MPLNEEGDPVTPLPPSAVEVTEPLLPLNALEAEEGDPDTDLLLPLNAVDLWPRTPTGQGAALD